MPLSEIIAKVKEFTKENKKMLKETLLRSGRVLGGPRVLPSSRCPTGKVYNTATKRCRNPVCENDQIYDRTVRGCRQRKRPYRPRTKRMSPAAMSPAP